jgi:NitT/TauT family transport system permease protein
MSVVRTKLLALLCFAAFFAAWEFFCKSGFLSPILLPAPSDVVAYIAAGVLDNSLPSALFVTLRRLAVGYSIGVILGTLLGILLYFSVLSKATLGQVALGLQTLPSVCWAPLSLLWFGQTESAMYFVVVMGSMWAIAIATENAIRMVPAIYVKAAQVMGSKGIHTWRTVIFPAAMPQLLNGVQLGWAFAWRSLMAAEIYVTIVTSLGIGQLLHFGRELHAMDQAIGIMLIIVLAGLLMERAVFFPLAQRMRRNRGY